MSDIRLGDYTDIRNNTLNAKMYSDKKYMILKMGGFLIATAGLGWYVLYVLRGIRYAIENGFIPIVDWQNCRLPQYEVDKVGKENIWEKFFEQPFQVGVMEAYASDDYFVVDDVRSLPFKDILNIESFVDFYNEEGTVWRNYFQKYVRIKKEVKEYFEENRKQLNLIEEKVIGVLVRGTDYRDLRPVGHCSPIMESEIFQYIDQILERVDKSKIFLATEDKYILENFEKKYPEMVCTVKTKRYEGRENETLNMIYKNENGYERDLKYLFALYNLSKCSTCICSPCGGAVLVSLMRENEGNNYKFLYQGINKAKGVIVGSYLEKQEEVIISMGNKPIMFYALNLIKLLKVEEVDIIISKALKQEYEKRIGHGEHFGLKINYIISENYDIMAYMTLHTENIKNSKLILLYADEFVHGKDVVKDLISRLNTFDGAYVWGLRTKFSENTESIRINERTKIPERAFPFYKEENYELMGRYIFDQDLADIIRQLSLEREEIVLIDILNEYIKRRKLFFTEYKRGTISLKINNAYVLKKTDQMISLMEELQKKKIGDFMSFNK